MFQLLDSLHWIYRFLIFIGAGLLLSLSLLYLPSKSEMRNLGRMDYLSPNWISIWRLPIVAVGQVCFFSAIWIRSTYSLDVYYLLLIVGFLIIVFGKTLDRIDGQVAMYQKTSLIPYMAEWPPPSRPIRWGWFVTSDYNEQGEKVIKRDPVLLEDWIYRLMAPHTRVPMFRLDEAKSQLELTNYGDSIDPAVDKVNFIPAFLYLAITNRLSWIITILMIVSELASTLIRPPFINHPWLSFLKNLIHETKAGPIGKTKYLFLVACLLAALPSAAGWLNHLEQYYSKQISSGILALGVLVGALSSLFRLRPVQTFLKSHGFGRYYQRFRRSYEHQ